MKYSPKYFYDNMPEWKRKKDPIIVRLIYRPISFVLASMCANIGISANQVSYFSALIALMSAVFFVLGTHTFNLCGAIFVNIWVTLDCVDGNLARSVKKQSFGEFADAISSYILTAVMGLAMGYSVYQTGGLLFRIHNPWIILLGGIASISDPLMRLIYHKFKESFIELKAKNKDIEYNDNHGDPNQSNSIKTIIEESLGVGGFLPAIILLCTIFKVLDIAVFYCFVYYGGSCIVVTASHIKKAICIKND